ncbi:MAG TPA: zf-HC2 domain-containing protein [Drouetiella sp.]
MDNSCTRYRTELSAFIDNELEKEQHSEVQIHISNCEQCTSELETLRSLTGFLSSNLTVQEDIVPNIWSAMQDSMPSMCELMRAELSAYLDGELTAAAQEGVNKHLKECADCTNEFKLLNSTNRLLVKGLELPANIKVDLWSAVKAQLNEDCALINTELSSYLDQEVETLRHRNITAHLIDCPDCRLRFNGLSSVGDLIRDAYQPELPENFDLWPEIKAKLQVVPFTGKQQAEQKKKFGGQRVYLTAAAAVMIAVIGSLAFWFGTPQPVTADTVSSEGYLIESALKEPTDVAEAAVYDQK